MKEEIIYTEQYALIVSDEQAKESDWGYIPFQGGDVKLVGKYFADDWKKVIAHRPLTDASILEGVTLLPEFGDEYDIVDNLVMDYITEEVRPYVDKNPNQHYRIGIYGGSDFGFRKGYNKAKETYKYTEEDLRKALLIKHDGLSVDYVIQSLQQQKRPKYFECEMEKVWVRNTDRNAPTLDDFDTIVKTITNSQGQTVLVGKYIY